MNDSDSKSKPIVVVSGSHRPSTTIDLMATLGASGMFGGVHVLGDKIKRSESDTEARIARAGVEAQLAKEAIDAAEAKRERRRLKRLNKEKK